MDTYRWSIISDTWNKIDVPGLATIDLYFAKKIDAKDIFYVLCALQMIC